MTTAAQAADQDTIQAATGDDQINDQNPKTDDELWAEAGGQRASTQADEDNLGDEGGDQDDPLAGLPEPTRKLFEQIQAKTAEQEAALAEVGQKLAKAHGTIGDLTHKLNKSLTEFGRVKPVIDAAEAARAKEAQEAEAARKARAAELEESMKELPDVKEYLDIRLADVKPAGAPAAPEPQPAAAKAEETPEQREARLIAERELSDRHPKWIETVRSKEFQEWKAKQPDDIKALGASDSVADADKLLTTFKKHQEDAAQIAKVEAERKERLRRGEIIQGKGSAAKSGDTSQDALWNQAKKDRERQKAQQSA